MFKSALTNSIFKHETCYYKSYLQRVNTEYRMQTQNAVGYFLHLQLVSDQ